MADGNNRGAGASRRCIRCRVRGSRVGTPALSGLSVKGQGLSLTDREDVGSRFRRRTKGSETKVVRRGDEVFSGCPDDSVEYDRSWSVISLIVCEPVGTRFSNPPF